MLEIQKYLINNSINSIEKQFNIIVKQSEIYPNLFLFKYNQIKSDFSQTIVQEARGIILDQNQNWKPVCYTYSKFFNYGEGFATKINWNNCQVTEKLDGSLIQLWWYDGYWHIATSGTPHGNCSVNIGSITFQELFWKVWNKLNYQLPEKTNYCFAFELITKYNKVVCDYDCEKIVLHGVRNLITLEEQNIKSIAKKYNWECIKTYSLNSLNECINAANKLNAKYNEGFVVVDNNWSRIKIKSPKYVAIHHLKNKFSLRQLIYLIQQNEIDEYISYFPEFKNIIFALKAKYENLIDNCIDIWNQLQSIENMKKFALKAKEYPFSDCLFKMKKNQIESILEYWENRIPDHIIEILNIKQWFDEQLQKNLENN